MNNAISRRTFLKCAGAATVAAGAASLLGGCSLDNIINKVTEDVPNMITMGNVAFALSYPYTYAVKKSEDSEEKVVKAVMPFLGVKDMGLGSDGDKELTAKNFKLVIDDVEAKIQTGADATKIKNEAFGADNTSHVLLLGDDGKVQFLQDVGALIFVPGKEIKEWKKAELTISYAGKSQTFVMTYKSNWEADIAKK